MKKSTKAPFMPADDYGRSLKGFNVNLVVREVRPIVSFLTEVLGVELIYDDPDLAVLSHEGVAWMISEGMRRDPEAPPFVPERCQSALSGCLALLTGEPDGFPNGLLLLLAGSGAAAATLGIISLDQDEASPPQQP